MQIFSKELQIFGKELQIFGKELQIFGKELQIFTKDFDRIVVELYKMLKNRLNCINFTQICHKSIKIDQNRSKSVK